MSIGFAITGCFPYRACSSWARESSPCAVDVSSSGIPRVVTASCSSVSSDHPASCPATRSTMTRSGWRASTRLEGFRHKVRRGDVEALLLEQDPDEVEKLRRSVHDEDVLPGHLLLFIAAVVMTHAFHHPILSFSITELSF